MDNNSISVDVIKALKAKDETIFLFQLNQYVLVGIGIFALVILTVGIFMKGLFIHYVMSAKSGKRPLNWLIGINKVGASSKRQIEYLRNFTESYQNRTYIFVDFSRNWQSCLWIGTCLCAPLQKSH